MLEYAGIFSIYVKVSPSLLLLKSVVLKLQ